MHKHYLPFLAILSFFTFITSCSSDEIDPILFGTNHYPVKKGQFVTYQVTRVLHNEIVEDDIEIFQRKEVVVDTFTDASNRIAYRIEQFTRKDASEPWLIDSVWVLRKEPARLIKIENNEPFIKLVFPIENGITWNGNAVNDFLSEEYTAEVLSAPFRLNGESFSKAIQVIHSQDSSIVDRDVRTEVYAENIGMVYKKTEVFQYINNFTNPFYAQDSVIGGIFFEQIAIDWGVE